MSDAPTVNGVRAWLSRTLAEQYMLDLSTVSMEVRFRELGLDSAQLQELIAATNEHWGCQMSSTAPWEYPTLRAFATHVATLCEPRPGATRASNPNHDHDSSPARSPHSEPVAIVGLACRLPGGVETPADLWALLCRRESAITQVPAQRWDAEDWFDADRFTPGKSTTRYGGFLADVSGFEPGFFGVTPREAAQVDPQQRLTLELAWEALEDAGIQPPDLRGRPVGVFTGAMWSDYARLLGERAELIDPYTATGQDTSIISARVSYFLGLQGPSLTVNTACSSSLVAIHLACQSLQRGESELALAGGVHLMCSPLSTVAMTKFGAMNPRGQCRAFDAQAAGYVRGEGAGLVVLEPLSRALAAGRRIYCVIRGSAINNDGLSNGLTAPNPKAQLAVLYRALADAGVEANTIDYVETHGPGTILGDPMEAQALGAALGARRHDAGPGDRTLKIGSVKTNLGHLEAAAGVAGLIKTALALHHQKLPPNLHFEQPNPHIDFAREGLQVVTALEPWPDREDEAPPRAGVSSFGFGGTNCHAVLEAVTGGHSQLLLVEAGDADTLRSRALAVFGVATALDGPRLGLAREHGPGPDDASTGSFHSSPPLPPRLRLAARFSTRTELLAELTAVLAAPQTRATQTPHERPKLVFVCPGHGSQWPGMLRGLLREPLVRQTIADCQRALDRHCSWSLLDALEGQPAPLEARARLEVVQVSVCTTAIALGRLWRAWGVDADAIVGHSLGEIAAAQLAGVLSLDQAMEVVLARCRAIARHAADVGGMLVVYGSPRSSLASLGPLAEQLSVAVEGAPNSTVLSGTHADLAAARAIFDGLGVRHARVDIDYPSHSRAMDPALDELHDALLGLRPRPASSALRSTVHSAWLEGSECGAQYWVRNLRDPVRLASAITAIADEGPCVFIELGGHPVVLEPIRQLRSGSEAPLWTLASGRRGRDARELMLDGLAVLYPLGVDPDWAAVGTVVGAIEGAARSVPYSPTGGELTPVLLSAKHPEGLRAQARRLRAWVAREPAPRLLDLAYSLAATRTHFDRRAVVLARDHDELIAALESIETPSAGETARHVEALVGLDGQLLWRFPAALERSAEIVAELLEHSPVFAASLDRCALASGAGEASLRAYLMAAPDRRSHSPQLARPAAIASMIALAEAWRALGVDPDALTGHGDGLVAAAVVAGRLPLEAALADPSRARAWTLEAGADATRRLLSPTELEPIADGTDLRSLLATGASLHVRSPSAAGYFFTVDFGLGLASKGAGSSASEEGLEVPGVGRDPHGQASLLASLAELHVRGLNIDWARALAPRCPAVIDLPMHAFVRERCWLPSPSPRDTPAQAPAARPRIIFVFPGQGGQWLGMGRELLAREPVFRQAIARCDRALEPHFEGSVRAELEAEASDSRLARNDVVQPVLWAFEVALAELWREHGVEADAVVGHSMGEIAAACVCGALSLSDGAQIVARRSRLARALAAGRGEMAVVELSIEQAERLVAESEGAVVVGVHNGPRACVLSGQPEALAKLLATLEERGVFWRRVKVDYASHSPLMEPLVEPLVRELAGVQPRPGRIPMMSTVSAHWHAGETLGPDYWARNLSARVRFAEAVERLATPAAEGPSADWGAAPRVFLEIGPHPVLSPAIAELEGEQGRPLWALSSLRRGEDEPACMARVLARLDAIRRGSPGVISAASEPARLGDAEPELRELSSPAFVGARVFETHLDPASMTHLDDHRVGGARVVAGAELVLLMLAAVNELQASTGPQTLESLTIPRAMVIAEGERPSIQVVAHPLERGEAASHTFELFARGPHSWTSHLRGRLAETPGVATALVDTRPAQRRIELPALYRTLEERGLAYGPAFRRLGFVEHGQTHFRAGLLVDAALTTWARSVVALDAAIHALLSFDPGGEAFVPVGFGRITRLGDPGQATQVHGRIRSRGADTILADLRLTDAADAVLVAIDGLRLAALSGLRIELPELLEIEWDPLATSPVQPAPPVRRVIVVAPPDGPRGFAEALAAQLEAAGDELRVLAEEPACEPGALVDADAIVWLAARDQAEQTLASGVEVLDTVLDRCARLRTLALTLAGMGRACPRLFTLTTGGEAVDEDDAPRGDQAALAALGATLAYEHPELRCVRIDLPDVEPGPEALAALVQRLRDPGREDRLALRGPRCLAARLRPATLNSGPAPRYEGTQLITGGLGGLGLRLATHLAEHGAKRLILLGRRGVETATQGDTIAAIEASGVSVEVHPCDVCDRAALTALLARCRGHLRGVFHLAATLDDGLLAELDRARFARVLAAKVAGAWNLHTLAAELELELEHFVMFSSIVARIGSPGQANYAAANAFLDALAVSRRRARLPGVAIGWGPFTEVGLVADAADALERRGLTPLQPARGLALLDRVLGDSTRARIGVASLDLHEWLAPYPALADNPSFAAHGEAALGSTPDPDTPAQGPRLRELLADLPPKQRRRLIAARVRSEIAAALRIDPERLHPQVELAELGLDSLTGLELRNRLEAATQLELPATFVWAHSRLGALVEALAVRLDPPARPDPEPDPDPEPEPDPDPGVRAGDPRSGPRASSGDDELGELSERELLEALRAELEGGGH